MLKYISLLAILSVFLGCTPTGAKTVGFNLSIKNTGPTELTNFEFQGSPAEFDTALQTCQLSSLQSGQQYSCIGTISTDMSGNADFTTIVTANNVTKQDTKDIILDDFTFAYSQEKLTGYYTVPKGFCPLAHCNECKEDNRVCRDLDHDHLYSVKGGYTEDFTYSSDRPVYGAWEIRNFDDFSDKCFVGDCNKLNKRHVMCITDENNIEFETFDCDKWILMGQGLSSSSFCIDGLSYELYSDGRFSLFSSCVRPKVVNFYYAYNDWDGYEGYDPNWQQRWEIAFEQAKQEFVPYGINLVANYFEVKLDDDSNLPGTLINKVHPERTYTFDEFYGVTILAGKELPSAYGLTCPGNALNPCAANSYIRIPDYREAKYGDAAYVLTHELGHAFGCPHTGDGTSLTAHLYMNDIMSYGQSSGEFLYECRIKLWLLGKNA